MSQPECSCSSLERLEGASVPAYIRAFLSEGDEKNHYRCRVCGREWEKRAPEVKSEGTRSSLVRL